MRRIVVLLLACLFGCAGCSSSGGNDETTKALESVLLQLSDFPPSWRSFPPSDRAGDLLGEVAACTGNAADAPRSAVAHSGEFRRGQQYITSTAVSYAGQPAVARVTTALGEPTAQRCVTQAVRARVLALVPTASVTGGRFTVQEGGINVAINDAGKADGVLTARVGGRAAKIYVDAVFIVGSNFYADVTFVGVNRPVADYIRNALTNDVALRAQHTLLPGGGST